MGVNILSKGGNLKSEMLVRRGCPRGASLRFCCNLIEAGTSGGGHIQSDDL